jgi:hypothetical protein
VPANNPKIFGGNMNAVYLSVIFLFCAASAHACPDMSGKWLCQNGKDQKPRLSTITMQSIPGGALYHSVEDDGAVNDWYADGQNRPIDKNGLTGDVTVSCDGVVVKGHENVQDAAYKLTASVDFSYALIGADEVLGNATSVVNYNGQPPQTQVFSEHCKRQ